MVAATVLRMRLLSRNNAHSLVLDTASTKIQAHRECVGAPGASMNPYFGETKPTPHPAFRSMPRGCFSVDSFEIVFNRVRSPSKSDGTASFGVTAGRVHDEVGTLLDAARLIAKNCHTLIAVLRWWLSAKITYVLLSSYATTYRDALVCVAW